MKKYFLFFTFFSFFTILNAQWPTTVDTALFVDFGAYPYLVVDDGDQSITIAYYRGGNELRAKKYDQYGYPLWEGNHVVLTDTTYGWLINELAYPSGQWGAVISDGAGGIIVAWEDFRHATFDWEGFPEGSEVYLQRVDKDGNILYGTHGKQISGPAMDGWHSIGDMKPDYNGGFYIGFSRDSTAEISVLKHFDMDGNLLWDYFFSGSFIDICATNLAGEVFINYKPDDEFSRQKLDLSGNKLWPDTLKGRIPEHKEYRAGGAFSDKNGGVIGVGAGALKIRRVDSTGQYAWDEVDLNQGQFSFIGYAPDGKGGIYVNWAKDGVNINRISVNGTLTFIEDNLKVCAGSDCQGTRGIINDNNGGAITIWGDTRKDSVTSFYAQHIDSTGKMLWDSLGLEFHSTEFDPFFSGGPLPLHADGNGGAILLWNECCSGNRIYIKQISFDGILGDVISSIPKNLTNKPNNFYLYQNYPNPFNNGTTISFQISNNEKVTLKVFNTIGKEIITLINKRLAPGVYSASMTLENFASGVYYYQLKTNTWSKTKKMLLIQ